MEEQIINKNSQLSELDSVIQYAQANNDANANNIILLATSLCRGYISRKINGIISQYDTKKSKYTDKAKYIVKCPNYKSTQYYYISYYGYIEE